MLVTVDRERRSPMRAPGLFAFGGAAVAAVAILLAGAAGEPYLSLSALNPWLVVYAIGLFVALFAAPFAIHARVEGRLEADARWERAMLWWGALTLTVLAAGLLVGLPSGFASDSLSGSLGIVTAVEAVLVLATLLVWVLGG
jgi:hypothetical protein